MASKINEAQVEEAFKAFDPKNIKVLKNVTLPQLKWKDEVPFYITIKGTIFKAKETTKGRARPATEGAVTAPVQPPELVEVLDLTTGELAHLITGTVLAIELRDTYPNDSYVGHSFMITKHKIEGNKRYSTYSIQEIEV